MEPEAVAPFARTTAAVVLTSKAGAACTEFADIAAVNAAAERTTPRLVKNNRNLSYDERVSSRRLARPQSRADFAHAVSIEEAQHDGVAIGSPAAMAASAGDRSGGQASGSVSFNNVCM